MKRYFLLSMVLFILFSCEDPYENDNFVVYDLYPAASYLETRQDEFSDWIEILKYADMYNAVNQASKSYTLFVPTNQAVQEFLTARGASSISDLTVDYAKALVRYHMISDAIDQKEFLIGGKLTKATVSGDYLDVSFDDSSESGGGVNSVYVNDEALVNELANEVTNGYVYVLDDVLTPLVETIYDRLVENANYSVFKEAVEATGWDETLSVVYDTIPGDYGTSSVVRRNYTAFVVDNATFGNDGISTMADLASTVGASSDYTNPENTLYQYVAYHILSSTRFIDDLYSFNDGDSTAIWSTQASKQVVSTHDFSGTRYLNYDSEAGTGIGLGAETDIAAKNGVLHEVDNYMPIFSPDPMTIIWDPCDYDDVASFVNAYGADNELGDIFQTAQDAEHWIEFTEEAVSSFTWKEYSVAGWYPPLGVLVTRTSDGGLTNSYGAYKHDMLVVNLGYLGNVTMQTPVLLKGKYKVELFYACAGSLAPFVEGGSLCKVSLDETSNEVYVYDGANASVGIYDMVLFDEVEFTETDNHEFELVLLDPRATTHSSYRLQLDYVKFTPINE